MNKVLENKYPYLSNFFKTAISQDRLFHSIILHGNNNYIQYAMALELARQLNCLEDKREDCNCQNCRWIRENQHPAIMTISPIDRRRIVTSSSVSSFSNPCVICVLISIPGLASIYLIMRLRAPSIARTEDLIFSLM